jgi:uncharacterized protein with PIN domain
MTLISLAPATQTPTGLPLANGRMIMTTYEPACPKCEYILDSEKTIDFYADENVTQYFRRGRCSKCGQQYQWKEIHVFSSIEELEEVNE